MRRLLPISACAALLAPLAFGAGSAAAATAISPAHEFAPRQVIVKFSGEREARTLGLPAGTGVRRAAAALRGNARVEYAEPDYIAVASATAGTSFVLPNDPGTLAGASGATTVAGDWTFKQWNFLAWQGETAGRLPTSPGGINAIGAWENLERAGRPGAVGTTVAVLDTGIAYRDQGRRFVRSPDFAAGQFAKGHDFIDNDRLPLDENGHGTHIAGTIGEKTDNAIGLTGLAYRAKLMPVRVLDRNGRGQASDIAKGIRFAIAHGADVINMSFNFGCDKKVPEVDEALREAYASGVVTVASAGNLGSETCVSEPATGPRVIGVGGTTEGGCLGDYTLGGGRDRPGRARRWHPGLRLPLGLGAADLPGNAASGLDPGLRDPRQLRRHLDGRGPRQRRRRDGARRRHLRRPPLQPENGPGGENPRQRGRRAPAQDRPRPRPAEESAGRGVARRGGRDYSARTCATARLGRLRSCGR